MKIHYFCVHRPPCATWFRVALLCILFLSLLGCNESINSAENNQVTTKIAIKKESSTSEKPKFGKGPRYRITTQVLRQPNCYGEACPSITFKKLQFEGHNRFNAFLEHALLGMTLIDTGRETSFQSLSHLANEFWKTAESRYEIVLSAEVKRGTASFIVIEMHSYLYSGGAHGMSTSMYINWSPVLDKIYTLDDFILPGRMKAFESVLKKHHAAWLEVNEFAQADQSAYEKTWPFQFADNAALMQDGIAITFDHYVLGPYALGTPTITVPFSELRGIVNMGLIKKLKVQG